MNLESLILAKYLVGEKPTEDVLRRYEKLAVDLKFNVQDSRLMEFVIKYPLSLSVLDPACGFFRPDCILRKKLHLMFSVLECEPAYADKFLTPQKADTNLFVLFFTACWSGLKAIPGTILLLFL